MSSSQNLHESCMLDFLARLDTLDLTTMSIPSTQDTINYMRSPFANALSSPGWATPPDALASWPNESP